MADNLTGTDDVNDEKHQPVVFTCCNCGIILTDSTSWLSCNEAQRTITVQSVTNNVNIKDGILTATEGDNLGSTYSSLCCKSCKNNLGKIFKSTPRHLDSIRDMFTLDVQSLEIYQVGVPGIQMGNALSDKNCMTVGDLNQHVIKMQSVLKNVSERLKKIENAMGIVGVATLDMDKENQEEVSGAEDTSDSDSRVYRQQLQSKKSNSSWNQSNQNLVDVKPKITEFQKRKDNSLNFRNSERNAKRKKAV